MTEDFDEIVADVADLDDRVNTQAGLLRTHHEWLSLLDRVQTEHAKTLEHLELRCNVLSGVVRRLVTTIMEVNDNVGTLGQLQEPASPQEAPPPPPAGSPQPRARRCA